MRIFHLKNKTIKSGFHNVIEFIIQSELFDEIPEFKFNNYYFGFDDFIAFSYQR